jgi:sec-independent protein translocase protein TatA
MSMSKLKTSALLLLPLVALTGCAPGPQELLIILAIVLLLFGATRLPQLGKALGETVKNFKSGAANKEPIEEGKDKANDQPLDSKKEEVAQIEDATVEPIETKKDA